jgi:AmiR/NasT family two-component response regulator
VRTFASAPTGSGLLDELSRNNSQLIERIDELQGALTSRIVIEQAKGVLCARHQLTMSQAFEALRRGARSNRLKLPDLARRVVEEAQTPSEITRYLA